MGGERERERERGTETHEYILKQREVRKSEREIRGDGETDGERWSETPPAPYIHGP